MSHVRSASRAWVLPLSRAILDKHLVRRRRTHQCWAPTPTQCCILEPHGDRKPAKYFYTLNAPWAAGLFALSEE